MAKICGKKLGIGLIMGVTCILVAGGLFGLVKSSLGEAQADSPAATTIEGNAGSAVAVGSAVPMDDAGTSECNFSSWVGQSARDAETAAKATGRPYRMLTPGSAMTMDFRADRINIELDGKGEMAKVTKVSCG